jgi:hypothetical protein
MIVGSVVAIYPMIDNYSAGNEAEWDDELDSHWMIRVSIAAHGKDGEPSSI